MMWILTEEEIVAASRETANMPDDWARRQLQKIIRVGNELCYNHAEPIKHFDCTSCMARLAEEAGL